MTRDYFANFPEHPEGMELRVKHSPSTVTLTSFHTISPARHKAQKRAYFFLVAPFFFFLFAGFLDTVVRLLFFRMPVHNAEGSPLPRWEVLAFFVPAFGLATLIAGFSTYYILKTASRLTRERPDWELWLLEKRWEVTKYHETIQSGAESNLERWYLKPSEIAELGVDEEGRVYCDEVTHKPRRKVRRVKLTPPLSQTEAAWVEQALRSVLTLAPSTL